MPKLYTRTGDKGKTSLRMGQRISKADGQVEAYGTVDELNSALGVAIAQLALAPWELGGGFLVDKLCDVQRDLFHIGAILAGEKQDGKKRLKFLKQRVSELEDQIDEIQKQLPEQMTFYLPGGSKEAADLDFARSVCRRAERRIVAIAEVERDLIHYMNRLSDFLYALARWINYQAGVEEKEWTGKV